MSNDCIEIKGYEDLDYYLKKEAIITFEVDDLILNVKRIRKGVRFFLALQNYGMYPYDLLLNTLVRRNNLKVFVYKNPPTQDKCPITDMLINFWIGGK